jgi:ActR/RegA family two-component response regulator/anti-sigma regulatory factor (Ser/Thr protein kinase)
MTWKTSGDTDPKRVEREAIGIEAHCTVTPGWKSGGKALSSTVMSPESHHPFAPPQPEGCPDAGENPVILVVDDSPFDRQLVGKLLEQLPHLKVVYADSIASGIDAVAREKPTIVLTDLILADGEGLALVKHVREQHPGILLVLMTAYGSEDVAMQALRAGAANYIAKRNIANDLIPTIRQVLEMAVSRRERTRILQSMVRMESVFVLDNDPDLIVAFMTLVREELAGMRFWDETGLVQVSIALQEALVNAVFHGNLEVSSEHRQIDEQVFEQIACERRRLEPYRSRRVRIHVQLDRDAARFSVSDDGPGFDASLLNRPVESEDLSRIGGRGLLLIRTFMDAVSFNSQGNQIVMIKHREGSK